MPDKITTLKLIDNTDVFPNIKDENIPDTIMRIADLSKYVNQLKSINITGDVDSATTTSGVATFTTADISTLNVSGVSQFGGVSTFGSDVKVNGKLTLNSPSDLQFKEGDTNLNEFDEFRKEFYDNVDFALFYGDELKADTGVLGQKGLMVIPYLDHVTNLTSFCENATAIEGYSDILINVTVPDIPNPVKCNSMFQRFRCNGIIFNNVTMTDASFAFGNSTSMPYVTVSDGKTGVIKGNIFGLFWLNESIVEIGSFDVSNVISFMAVFHGCISLKHLHFKHFRLSFDISDSTAFEQSDLVEIISNLDPVSTPQTMTIGATNLAKLTQDQILVATGKGWTLA